MKSTGDCESPLLSLRGIHGKALSSRPSSRKTSFDSVCDEFQDQFQSSMFDIGIRQAQAVRFALLSMRMKLCTVRMSSLRVCKSRPQVAPNNIRQKSKEFDLGAVLKLLFGASAIVSGATTNGK